MKHISALVTYDKFSVFLSEGLENCIGTILSESYMYELSDSVPVFSLWLVVQSDASAIQNLIGLLNLNARLQDIFPDIR